MIPPRALILAAGRGTRLRPTTHSIPKCLVPIGGRPLLDYWLIRLAAVGVREIVINTHHLPDAVRTFMASVNRRGGQKIAELFEPQLLGSAGTISATRALADGADDLFVVYGDNYTDADLAAMLEFHRRHDSPITMMLFRTSSPRDCGIAQMAEDGRIVAFEEKPVNPRGNLANAGVFVMKADAYREIADAGGFDLGRDVLPRFVSRMRGWSHHGHHTDIGTPERYASACLQSARVNTSIGVDPIGLRPAVFLHRDGVLVDRSSGSARPRLVTGAAEAVVALRRRGYACLMLAAADVHASVDEQVCDAFAAEGAVFDAVRRYPAARTPHRTVPDAVVATAISAAAMDLKLDLAKSWRVDLRAGVTASEQALNNQPRLCVADVRSGNCHKPAFTACDDFAHLIRLMTEARCARREALA